MLSFIQFPDKRKGLINLLSIKLDPKAPGQQTNGTKGETVDFAAAEAGVTLASDTSTEVQVNIGASGGASWWVDGAQWIVGSANADVINLSANMRGAEGGDGNDIIDARLVGPGSSVGPLGYNAELYGGAGDDTLISSSGDTIAYGGDGSNTFILSSLSSNLVIADAKASDKRYVPYNFFQRLDWFSRRITALATGGRRRGFGCCHVHLPDRR